MPAVIFLSPQPFAGKTTVVTGLAWRLRAAGRAPGLTRLPGDKAAEADGELLSRLSEATGSAAHSTTPDLALIEAPSGDPRPSLDGHPDARAVVVGGGPEPVPTLVDYSRGIGDRLAGVIINKTPARRMDTVRADAEAAGLTVIAVLPEDRLLAAPVLRDVAGALSAHVEHLGNGGLRPLDRPVIATISADPGQGYFAHYDATAVIVRSDKPDLQLAALNAGASCLIVTGGLPLLSYVLNRAEDDQIPLLRTGMDTISAVKSIEELFGSLPFAGGDAKLERISTLLADANISSLIA